MRLLARWFREEFSLVTQRASLRAFVRIVPIELRADMARLPGSVEEVALFTPWLVHKTRQSLFAPQIVRTRSPWPPKLPLPNWMK